MLAFPVTEKEEKKNPWSRGKGRSWSLLDRRRKRAGIQIDIPGIDSQTTGKRKKGRKGGKKGVLDIFSLEGQRKGKRGGAFLPIRGREKKKKKRGRRLRFMARRSGKEKKKRVASRKLAISGYNICA